jgi:alpha-1,2-mannosyltransferase
MLAALTAFAGVAVTVVPVLLLTLGVVCRVRRLVSGRAWPAVAFFHPYCNDGGGGERVLWIGIEALLAKRPGLRCAVFTGDEIDPATILQNVQDRFGLELPGDAIDFVYLTQRPWVEAKRYPRLTLLGQSVGSMILALEAVLRLPTAVFGAPDPSPPPELGSANDPPVLWVGLGSARS